MKLISIKNTRKSIAAELPKLNYTYTYVVITWINIYAIRISMKFVKTLDFDTHTSMHTSYIQIYLKAENLISG